MKPILRWLPLAVLLLVAAALIGPDGGTRATVRGFAFGLCAVLGVSLLLVLLVLAMIVRDARHDIDVSVSADSGHQPSAPPELDPEQDPSSDLYTAYMAGLSRGRTMERRAMRLHPAHEVCGTAE